MRGRQEDICSWLQTRDIDIACIQEDRLDKSMRKTFAKKCKAIGREAYFGQEQRKRGGGVVYNGLLTVVRKGLGAQIRRKDFSGKECLAVSVQMREAKQW